MGDGRGWSSGSGDGWHRCHGAHRCCSPPCQGGHRRAQEKWRGEGAEKGTAELGGKPSPAAWGNVVLSKCAHPGPPQGSALPGEWSPTVQEPPAGPQPPAAPMGSCWRGLKAPRVQGCWGPRSQCCQGAEPWDRRASGAAECVQLGSDARQRDSKS